MLSGENRTDTIHQHGRCFFRRQYQAQCELINDINRNLTNLFRVPQRHYSQFMDVLKL